jgi:hypothetical protein
MKAKFGAIVVAGSGKLGGHVASKNKSGAYFRTKVTPINRNTTYQSVVRSRLTSLSQAFRSLTAARIAAWNSAAASFSKTNAFGDKVILSGAQLYQRLNNNLLVCSQSVISDPPLPNSVASFTSLALTAAKGTPAMSLAFAGAIAATESVKLFATAGQSAGKSFIKSEYRLIGILETADTTPKDILSLYTAKFGTVPAAGMKVYVKAVHVSHTTGLEGQAVSAYCVVSA